MAASITNSNETLDSITTGLLIHEFTLALRSLQFHMSFVLILHGIFSALALLLALSLLLFHCHISSRRTSFGFGELPVQAMSHFII